MLRSLIAPLAAGVAVSLAGAAQATTYFAALSGSNESPPNASPATGLGSVVVDDITDLMSVTFSFSDLQGLASAAHIHCCTASPETGTAGVATQTPFFIGFQTGVTSGSYSQVFNLLDASTYNPAFVTANGGTASGAETALLTGLASGEAYLNVHTTLYPGGEIRGFLTAVPEPGAWTLTILGFGLVGGALRQRKAAFA